MAGTGEDTRYLEENQHKKSIADDAGLLRQLDPFIGDPLLKQVHMGTLQPFIAKRQQDKHRKHAGEGQKSDCA